MNSAGRVDANLVGLSCSRLTANTAASALPRLQPGAPAPPRGIRMQRSRQKGQTACWREAGLPCSTHPRMEAEGQNYVLCARVCLVCACVAAGVWRGYRDSWRRECPEVDREGGLGCFSSGHLLSQRNPWEDRPGDGDGRCAAGTLCWPTLHPTPPSRRDRKFTHLRKLVFGGR